MPPPRHYHDRDSRWSGSPATEAQAQAREVVEAFDEWRKDARKHVADINDALNNPYRGGMDRAVLGLALAAFTGGWLARRHNEGKRP